jgi:hypothetical protein
MSSLSPLTSAQWRREKGPSTHGRSYRALSTHRPSFFNSATIELLAVWLDLSQTEYQQRTSKQKQAGTQDTELHITHPLITPAMGRCYKVKPEVWEISSACSATLHYSAIELLRTLNLSEK